jgi:hypothetical protein
MQRLELLQLQQRLEQQQQQQGLILGFVCAPIAGPVFDFLLRSFFRVVSFSVYGN